MRRTLIAISLLVATAANARVQKALPLFTAGDRIVVVAPHPDDEILGAGGVIQQALAVGADVRIIYLTNGDHNQIAFKLYNHSLVLRPRAYLAFGERRRNEGMAATGHLGLAADHLTFLGYPDWGTLRIWRDYWDDEQPFRSDSTRVAAVPYREDFGYQHPYKPQAIAADFETLFRQFCPTKVFVSHPCDTNPDHRAAANFVRLALLDSAAGGVQAQLYYYVIHFGPWPRPYHYHPELELEPPRQLLDDGDWMTLPLTPAQTQKKHDAILCNRTQTTVNQYHLVAYARTNELFAAIEVPGIPNLPPGVPLDWRKAVRNKVIAFGPGEPEAPLDNQASPSFAGGSIALEQTRFLRQGDDLITAVELKNRLGKRTNVHVLLYGYKQGEEFEKFPKINVNVTPLGNVHVYDGGKRLSNHGVTLISVSNRLIIRVPFDALGGKGISHLFTATGAHLGEIRADDSAWRLFALSNGHSGSARSLASELFGDH